MSNPAPSSFITKSRSLRYDSRPSLHDIKTRSQAQYHRVIVPSSIPSSSDGEVLIKTKSKKAVTNSRSSFTAPKTPSKLEALNTQPKPTIKRGFFAKFSNTQMVLVGMACLIFVIGLFVSIQSVLINRDAVNQVNALARQSVSYNHVNVPSTVPPSANAIADYQVAPNLPRYLNIDKLDVHARVFPLGLLKGGALATPDNVFDTGWYDKSAQPGQPGAILIDGHISSWTAHGVFYGLKSLQLGDTVQIVRGDGVIFTYQVVKTQIYSANQVNMRAAITPAVNGVPGLNLISCSGDVIPGTSLYNERIVVFTKQISP